MNGEVHTCTKYGSDNIKSDKLYPLYRAVLWCFYMAPKEHSGGRYFWKDMNNYLKKQFCLNCGNTDFTGERFSRKLQQKIQIRFFGAFFFIVMFIFIKRYFS
jgi:hypothetical protein